MELMVVGLLVSVLFGFWNRSIVRKKGYVGVNAFIGGFCLTWVSTIYCVMQPKTIEKQAEEAKKLKELMKD